MLDRHTTTKSTEQCLMYQIYSNPFSSFGDDSWFNSSRILPAFREGSSTSILVMQYLIIMFVAF
jgi:hypothetical protein